MVSCFLTPSLESSYTYPPLLAREVEQVVGEYLFDCTNFRTDDKDDLLRQVYEMTDRRFRLAEHLLETKPWELFAMVEMGLDRMHHGFWKDMDERHRRHDPGGRTRTRSSTTTATSTRSSRGCSRMPTTRRPCSSSPTTARSGWTAASAINEWLRARGPARRRSREPDGVDRARATSASTGARTTAWGEGGYYGRVFLNVARPRARGHGRARGLRARARRARRAAGGDPRPGRASRSARASTGPRRSTTR